MADTADGWQTVVLPHAHSRVNQLDRAQLAAYERQALDLWAQAEGGWSGWYVENWHLLLSATIVCAIV